MTYPTPPARSGMPTWAKWTIIGCAGCLTIVIIGMVGCSAVFYQLIGKNMKLIDVGDKPDPPLTATASQLLPPRVGNFVRRRVTHTTPQIGNLKLPAVWQGIYTSGGKRVQLEVKQTASAQRDGSQQSPFGRPSPPRNSNMGIHMSMKMGGTTVDVVSWAKPNWTFTVESQDMISEQFARTYQPGP